MTEGDARGVAGAVAQVSERLIAGLPAQFLGLCLINLVFIAALFWFLDRRDVARERLLTPILASCLQAEQRQR